VIFYIVGRFKNFPDQWEFQGVFDDKQKAVEACRDCTYFIGPVRLNEKLPDEMKEWPGAYYPKPDIERA
jgi:hypothetical protein